MPPTRQRMIAFLCDACVHRFAAQTRPAYCPSCSSPNSCNPIEAPALPEQATRPAPRASVVAVNDTEDNEPSVITSIGDVEEVDERRVRTGILLLDRLLDMNARGAPRGGILGRTYLVSGQKKVGKSTLMRQAACSLLERRNCTGLYLIAEYGDAGDIQLRQEIEPLGILTEKVKQRLKVRSVSKLSEALEAIGAARPRIIITDSLQRIRLDRTRSNGEERSIIEVCAALMAAARDANALHFLISHANKEGEAAGPEALAHDVNGSIRLEHGQLIGSRWVGLEHPLPAGRGGVIRMSSDGCRGSAPGEAFFRMTGKGLVAVKGPANDS